MKLIRKLLSAVAGLLILLGAYVGVFSLLAAGKRYPLTGKAAPTPGLRGAYHVHGTASDGTLGAWAIGRAAARAGLSFVVLTDHNVEVLPPPRWVRGVLVIHQAEESTPYGHVVALGVPRGLNPEERRSDPIAAIHRLGGKAVLAHPVQKRNPWTDWNSALEADGLELHSGDTMWRQALERPGTLACAMGAYLANPTHGLLSLATPQPEATARLLEISSASPRVGLCAVDAHGRPPYEQVFSTLSMHLSPEITSLPEDPLQASQVVLDQLSSGKALCVFDALGDAEGFALEGLVGRTARMGATVSVKLPPTGKAQARVLVHGAGRLEDDGKTVRLTRAGAAQVEVQLLAPDCAVGQQWRPWIVTSPFKVLPAGELLEATPASP